MTPSNPDSAKTSALVVCVDKNLLWQAAFFLNRAMAAEADDPFDYYLYTTDPLDGALAACFPDAVKIIEVREDIVPKEDFKSHGFVTPATLLRIKALEELCRTYARVIYSDVDMFLRWGKFSDLLALEPFDAPVAAVRDACFWEVNPTFVNQDANFFSKAAASRYFNAGFLFANGPKYTEQQISQQAMDFLLEQKQKAALADQTALNVVLSGTWLELPPSWNWQCHVRSNIYLSAYFNPRLVHFSGNMKPWNDPHRMHGEMYIGEMQNFLNSMGLHDIATDLALGGWTSAVRMQPLQKQLKLTRKAARSVEPFASYLASGDFADIW